ncbi:C-terminal binding protein [Mesorhizobium sp. BH1-1-5]|uniref:C-terminal binding protein n=1 Tax=Mesorhizobium sp. BH1-1-5 TaxID=2876661 RepID=UPI001CCCEF10|nr:C-terminal binding protein [Mesorhizobium sp. BH1-1-5]MBZ9988183.1 C-terminal binding protein [Mesorhizobium sp. BH1-1-5]
MTRKVVITDYTFPEVSREEQAARAAGAAFEALQCSTAQDVVAAVAGADVVAVQFAPFTAAAARAVAPGATIIRYGVGYDNIDLAAARTAGLKVGYVPDYCADEVADHTAAAALALLRKLVPLDRSVRAGEWAAVRHARPMKPFDETVFGFFGMGQIGRAVHARLRGLGFRFIVADPAMSSSDAAALDVERVDSDTLLRRADIVSLHAPSTPETVGFLNADRLARMQPHAMIVNSARGQLIVEADLAAALKEGRLAGAALDVFAVEPLPLDSPLRDAPNLLLTPHAAWYSDGAIGRLQKLVAQDISRALNGEPPRKPVRTD